MQAEVEINKKKEEVKGNMQNQFKDTEAKQKLLRNVMNNNAELNKARQNDLLQNMQKDLQNKKQDN